jgi:putative FmdB family regulatory protein
MPIYEYRCRGCGTDFEKYVPGARTAIVCPSCQGSDVMRKLSVFGLRSDVGAAPAASMSGGGGCCGGGCGCH